jgi:AcrR family transcriptional regulator
MCPLLDGSANLSQSRAGEGNTVTERGDGVDSRRTDTRERALSVALELFTRQGYNVTSLREIAEQLGVTKAALYFHFRTKDEILTAILRGYLDGIAELVEDAADRRPLSPADQEDLVRRFAAHQEHWGMDLIVLVRHNLTEIQSLPIGAEIKNATQSLMEALAPEGAAPGERLRVRMALSTFQVAALDRDSDEKTMREAALALSLEILRGGRK